jgi:type II secretory pathway pseudopilin PulG
LSICDWEKYSKVRLHRTSFGLQSKIANRKSKISAFTLIEMLTTVAVLVIVLGLMVSLARDVRNRSADRLTNDLLVKLDRLMAEYESRNHRLPEVYPFLETRTPEEQSLGPRAQRNNSDLVRALKSQQDLALAFNDQSIAIYDDVAVRDAWGSPIVYMNAQHPAIGMATGNRFFFVSAGPDGKYLSRHDNLYSYETAKSGPVPTTGPPEGTP